MITSSKSCSESFNKKLSLVIPAEFTTIDGGLLKTFTTSLRAFKTFALQPTSTSKLKCCAELFCRFSIVFFAFSRFLSTATTLAPSLANTSHVARPIPDPAPVKLKNNRNKYTSNNFKSKGLNVLTSYKG